MDETCLKDEIYDMAAKTGSSLIGSIDKATIGNMFSLFQGISDPNDALKFLMAYIARQISKGEIRRFSGEMLLRDLAKIYKECKKDELRNVVIKYLTLVKWFYEANIRNLNSFEDFIKRYGGI